MNENEKKTNINEGTKNNESKMRSTLEEGSKVRELLRLVCVLLVGCL